MRQVRHWIGVLLAGAAFAPSAMAATQDDAWQFRTTLYAWASSLDGDIAVAPLPRLSVSQGFGDALSSLDAAAMAVVDARRGRWSMWSDLQAVNASQSGRVPPLGLDGRARVKARGALLAGGYALAATERARVDLIAGLRYWSLDARIGLDVPPGVPLPAQAATSRSAVVTQVGLRGTWSFEGRLFATGWALVGGGGGMDRSSDLMAALGVAVGPSTELLLGYRRVDLAYAGGRLDFDAAFHGPGLALGWRF